jgi:DNA-binding LytR/AlgR family response regulator
MTTKIWLCDDEMPDLTKAEKALGEFADVEVRVFNSAWDMLDYATPGNFPDAVITDILMPGWNGVKLAASLREAGFGGMLAFLTTSNNFASEAFQVEAADYILKPVTRKRIEKFLAKLTEQREQRDKGGITLETRGEAQFIKFSQIMYIESYGNTLTFHLKDGEQTNCRATLKAMLEKLPSPPFAQLGRCYIVNMSAVTSCKDGAVILRNGMKLYNKARFSEFRDKWVSFLFDK